FVGEKYFGDTVKPNQRLVASAHVFSFLQKLVEPSIQTNAICVVPLRRVGKDDSIAFLQSVHYLYRIDRRAPKSYLNASGARPVRIDLEQTDRAVVLPVHGPANIKDILESFEFNRTVDAQIGNRAFWQFAFERRVNRSCAVLNRRIYTNYSSRNYSVARVDCDGLPELNVLGLSFSDLEFRFELFRICYSSEFLADCDLLSNLHRNGLQFSVDPSANLQR